MAARCRIASYGLGLTRWRPRGAAIRSTEHVVVRLAPEDLDEAAEHDERGVVVGEGLARREELGEVGERGDVLLDGVLAAAGVGEDVALEAGGVRQQVASGECLGRLRVADDASSGR